MGPRRRRSRSTVCWAVGIYALLQLALGVLLVWWMPWLRSPSYCFKLRGLGARRNATEGSTTVVMLGSSRTVFALRGTLVDESLSAAVHRPVVVYNFGQWGAGTVTDLLTLRRLLTDGKRPDVVLVEVFPALLDGRYPLVDLQEDALPVATLRRDELALLRPYAASRKLSKSDWWLASATPAHGSRLALVSYTIPTLLSPEQRLDGFRHIDPSGWIPVHPKLRSSESRRSGLALAEKAYARRLADYQIGGPPSTALESLLALCQRERIRAALVVLPEGPVFRSWYGPGAVARLHAYLDSLNARFGVGVIDAWKWLDSEDAYLDSHHLLPEGAEVFTRRLAEEALLPLLRESEAGVAASGATLRTQRAR